MEHERYNWHPAVHVRFGEKLYFYLIRLKSPLRPEDQLRQILSSADISYACEYAIYGHWDALVRVWLTDTSQRRFLFALRRAESAISDVRHFQVSQLRYLWTGSSKDLLADSSVELDTALAERRDEINLAVNSGDQLDSVVREKLKEKKLIFKRPEPEGDDPVKFYVCLKTYTNLEQAAEVEQVLHAITSAKLTERSSLYTGVGSFADHLLRCVADTYSDVLSLSVALASNLNNVDVRPMTLLVANSDAAESDNVNDPAPLSTDDQDILRLLDLPETGPALLESLPGKQRHALYTLVQSVYKQSEGDSQLREKLRDLLRASVKNDREQLGAAIVFLLDFEWYLSEYLKRAWASAYGENWINRLAEEFASNDKTESYEETVRKPADWTLGACVHMAIASASANTEVKAQLTRELGPEWPAQMRTLVELRNLLAHGKLRRIDSLDDFTGEWGKLLSDFMSVAALHFRCERLVNKETDHDD
jgi:hypothetical protein